MKPVTMPLKDRAEFKYRLLMSLGKGRKQAITGKELAQIFSHKNDRQVRLIIRELIRDGFPIISSTETPGGYFLPISIEEAKSCTTSLRSRAIEIFLRRREIIKNTALYLKGESQGRLL